MRVLHEQVALRRGSLPPCWIWSCVTVFVIPISSASFDRCATVMVNMDTLVPCLTTIDDDIDHPSYEGYIRRYMYHDGGIDCMRTVRTSEPVFHRRPTTTPHADTALRTMRWMEARSMVVGIAGVAPSTFQLAYSTRKERCTADRGTPRTGPHHTFVM
ncbi:hypothetical protein OG21DRAFT_442999 [Imleria badia]|nr:hypothetical protein OG21DRAFT_442999 [Imleria badia]